MTYNFDPDRWYRNERMALEEGRRHGDLSEDELEAALEKLEVRYDEMTRRLDGTYQIPG